MKLYFVLATLFLVQMAFADKRPPISAKFLFDNDGGDRYVISQTFHKERYDPRVLQFDYSDGFHEEHESLLFVTGTQYWGNPEESILVRKEKSDSQELSFAVESYGSEETSVKDFCHEKTSLDLRGLILACHGNIVLRNLTGEEREQVAQFKEDYKKNHNLFKVAYDRNQIKTQFVKIARWNLYQFETPNNTRTFQLSTNQDTVSYQERTMKIDEPLTRKRFIIDGLASDTEVNCKNSYHPDLRVKSCIGPIQLRKLNRGLTGPDRICDGNQL